MSRRTQTIKAVYEKTFFQLEVKKGDEQEKYQLKEIKRNAQIVVPALAPVLSN